MDFLLRNPTISKFLMQYPRDMWQELIVSTIINGIPYTSPSLLSSDKPELSSLPLLRQQLNSMKEELDRLNKSLEEPKKSFKSISKKAPPEIKTPKKTETRTEETPRFQKSPNKKSTSPLRNRRTQKAPSPTRHKSSTNWRISKPPTKPRIIPKYLQNVDSKIKGEVQKDIANYRSLAEDSIEQSSLSLLDLADKDTKKESQGIFETSESKSNSFSITSDLRLVNTLEGTFTNQEIVHKNQPSTEIAADRDFDTPRYPTDFYKDTEESEILEIAENFLSGPLMAELCNMGTSSERIRCIKSQQVPPLDLLSSDENVMPFRRRWEEATKDIGKKWEGDFPSRDYKKITNSSEFVSGRSSAIMMVQTPSPIPYDDKFGPMCQDASYSKYF